MMRIIMRRIGFVAALFAAAIAAPVAAQLFSEGYEFLKAVKDRDGEAVTDALNQPGTTVVNTRDISSGETALHIVTQRRDAVWIKFLAQRGANPNIRDKRGVAPIQVAVQLGFVEGVEALIDAGADVDVTDVSGETPLIAAVHRRDVGLVRLLLANNANPDRSDNSGRTARDYATLLGSRSAILEEFVRADEERASEGKAEQYGPS
jgi:ankyrin repeat protein